jgi:hypothetical protein
MFMKLPLNHFKAGFVYIFLIVLLSCAMASDKVTNPDYPHVPQKMEVNAEDLAEVSGIAASKVNPGHIWVQEDGGNPASLTLLKNDGSVVKSIPLNGIGNRDWEDMCVFIDPASRQPFIYIADIGDNGLIHTESQVYRFAEPKASTDTVRTIDRINFYYADGSHNAEAFLVDPVTKDILIITKSKSPSKIYKIPFPYSTTSSNMAEFAGELPYGAVVSAAQSPDGKGIAIKSYGTIYYYSRRAKETIVKALKRPPNKLPYEQEPIGEAITFANDNSGYFTMSEKC